MVSEWLGSESSFKCWNREHHILSDRQKFVSVRLCIKGVTYKLRVKSGGIISVSFSMNQVLCVACTMECE